MTAIRSLLLAIVRARTNYFARAWLLVAALQTSDGQAASPNLHAVVVAVPTANTQVAIAANPAKTVARLLLLVRSAGDDELIHQLQVELERTPYRILEIRLDPRIVEPGDLGTLAQGQAATAAIRVNRNAEVVELWIDRPEGAKADILLIEEEPFDARLCALRIAESLRAHGLDLGPNTGTLEPTRLLASTNRNVGASPPLSKEEEAAGTGEIRSPGGNALRTADASVPSSNGAPDAARAHVQAKRRQPRSPSKAQVPSQHLWLALGPGAMISPGGLPLGAFVAGRLGYQWQRVWTATLLSNVPIVSQGLDGTEGRAEVRSYALGLSLDRTIIEHAYGTMALGVGTAGNLVTMQGQAATGYTSQPVRLYVASGFVQCSLRIRLSDRLRVGTHLSTGAFIPRIRVQFAESTAAHFGQPFAAATLELEYLLWR